MEVWYYGLSLRQLNFLRRYGATIQEYYSMRRDKHYFEVELPQNDWAKFHIVSRLKSLANPPKGLGEHIHPCISFNGAHSND